MRLRLYIILHHYQLEPGWRLLVCCVQSTDTACGAKVRVIRRKFQTSEQTPLLQTCNRFPDINKLTGNWCTFLTPSRPAFTGQFASPVPPPPSRAPAEVRFLDTWTSKCLESDIRHGPWPQGARSLRNLTKLLLEPRVCLWCSP